jgi:uncharacterized protein YuzE
MATRLVNRRGLFKALAASGITSAVLIRSVGSVAAEKEVALANVPDVVKKAASEVVPDAKWSGAYQDTEDGQVIYELEGEDAQERDVTVDVTASGKVTAVEMEMVLADVPQVVTAAVSKRLPKFQATAAYAIRRGMDLARMEPNERVYALDGSEGNDREVSVEVTADGKIVSLEREIAVADVPSAVMEGLKKQMPMFRATSAHEIHEGESITGYVVEGMRLSKAKKAKANVEIAVYVSADGKEVLVDEP